MVILFLLALLLAWPTFGLSIVAYVALIVLRGYLVSKTRMHHANVGNAERAIVSGSRQWPSWMEDKGEALVFVEAIQQSAMRQGVPRSFLQGILAEPGNAQGLFFFAGAMEREGASFLEQQVGCSDKLVEMWNLASPQGKTAIMNKGIKAAADAIRPAQKKFDLDDEIPF